MLQICFTGILYEHLARSVWYAYRNGSVLSMNLQSCQAPIRIHWPYTRNII